MGFLYDWQFVFKASEIVEMLNRKIIELEAEIITLQAKIEREHPEDGYSPEVREAIELLERKGLKQQMRIRTVSPDKKNLDTAEHSLWRLKRVRHLLRREDPHRQFKLTMQDAIDMGYRFDDE